MTFCGAGLDSAHAELFCISASSCPYDRASTCQRCRNGGSSPTEPVAVAKPENRLETLYGELKRQRNEKAAERIASRIFEEWNHSGSASIDLMMLWSQKAIEAEKFDVALDFLDQVVTLSPDFAEGWNRRATVHFMMRSFGKSMADIDRTLQLSRAISARWPAWRRS